MRIEFKGKYVNKIFRLANIQKDMLKLKRRRAFKITAEVFGMIDNFKAVI